MLFVMIDKDRYKKLVPAGEIDAVEIYPDNDDKILFLDGSTSRVGNFYESLVEIKGKEIGSL